MSTGAPACWALILLGVLFSVTRVDAQQDPLPVEVRNDRADDPDRAGAREEAESRRIRGAADRATGLHVVISRSERRLWLRDGSIVLYRAEVAVGKGGTLSYGARTWEFSTPAGRRTILAKEEDPVWVPPDWHYVEIARERALSLVPLRRGEGAVLADGSRVEVRGDRIARVWPDGRSDWIPPAEEVVFGDTLFVPPFGTRNRQIAGELGRYKLDLGDGYLIHGTPHQDSIGTAVTHGCIRLRDEDLMQLYSGVTVGAPVYIY